MRFKSPKRCSLRAFAFLAVSAFALFGARTAAALTVTPPGPNLAFPAPTDSSVFYLSTNYATSATAAVAATFTQFDFTNAATTIQLDIDGADTTPGLFLWAYAEDLNGTTAYPVTITNCDGNGQVTIGLEKPCNYGANSSFRIFISLKDICTKQPSARGCLAGAVVDDGSVAPPHIAVGFRLRFITGATTQQAAAVASGVLLQVFAESKGPTLATQPPAPGFFPGDGSIEIDSSGFLATQDTTAGGSTVFTNTVIVAEDTANNPAIPANPITPPADVVQSGPYQSGAADIGGFTNSTDAAHAHLYNMEIGVQDSAGAITFSSVYPNVFTTNIQGFLNESKCYVATASFRDGRAPGVLVLRHFRDQVLEKFSAGRDFIGWYYANGPVAANWLIAHPNFRSLSLTLLLPLQGLAWTALHPSALAVPFLALLGLLAFFARRARLLGLVLLGLLVASPKAHAAGSNQPYIDSLISEVPKSTTPAATNEHPDPYIESVKKKIGPNSKDQDGKGYTDEIRKEIGPHDGSEGYAEKIQKTLPGDEGSAIEDYRKGKKLHANKGSLDTRTAFGFNINASATRTYTSGADNSLSYDSVYGNKWIPDFTLHYEWRPFTFNPLKKFALYTSIGSSFTRADGIFQYVPKGIPGQNFPDRSHTQFTFVMIPVNVGLMYRFSVFDFVWPYFGAGPSAICFTENRNDHRPGHHGLDEGYWFMGGVAFGLDWLSSTSSWDQYETAGIKHSYFTIDYSYLTSLNGGIVSFTVDGVNVGFTFEL